jgi:hypothetical protein
VDLGGAFVRAFDESRILNNAGEQSFAFPIRYTWIKPERLEVRRQEGERDRRIRGREGELLGMRLRRVGGKVSVTDDSCDADLVASRQSACDWNVLPPGGSTAVQPKPAVRSTRLNWAAQRPATTLRQPILFPYPDRLVRING